MPDAEPVFWPLARLIDAFTSGMLSPVEVTEDTLSRIDALDDQLHSYLTVMPEMAMEQAKAAANLYRSALRPLPPLLGVPVSIKDLFDVRGMPTSLGSLAYGHEVAHGDSQPVARLRAAGAIFLGKTNTAEFGQSATTINLLGPACGNPWDPSRTPGGSSGGAAASVGAGFASAALGSDGGGSIRIPAAMCGLVGAKPTFVGTAADDSFHAMTEFACSGPITRNVADARLVLSVLLSRSLGTARRKTARRIGWCPDLQGQSVDSGIRNSTANAITLLEDLGHMVDVIELPVGRWLDAFGPLVIADEWRYRRHLLDEPTERLTSYARKSIGAGAELTDSEIAAARKLKEEIGSRVAAIFDRVDLIITPTVASTAFPLSQRPTEIDGRKIDPLWGPFPFTAPFNVSGSPAVSVPVGLVNGLPVGLQVVGSHNREEMVLDLCEEIEAAVAFPRDEMVRRWRASWTGID